MQAKTGSPYAGRRHMRQGRIKSGDSEKGHYNRQEPYSGKNAGGAAPLTFPTHFARAREMRVICYMVSINRSRHAFRACAGDAC